MKSILIVDDEPAIAENLQALLNAKGYKVALAGDGAEAVEIARRDKPDLMLLDVMLPKMGGFDVCSILKADQTTQTIKIIMITATTTMPIITTRSATRRRTL